MTFSLVGRCERTGGLGAVCASSSPAVAARCVSARTGVGAACTQNLTDPLLARALLERLASGSSAQDALRDVVAGSRDIEYRQLAIVDARGRSAVYSGERTLGHHAEIAGPDCASAGNLLRDPGVPAAMIGAFGEHPGEELGDRLFAALRAGREAGGEEGPVHSCGMVVVDELPWYVTDLRVDWRDDD